MAADKEYIDVDTVVQHETVAKVECCGCLVAIRSGRECEIRCNECDALIDTVALNDLEATMTKLAMPMWEEVTSEALRSGKRVSWLFDNGRLYLQRMRKA